MAVRSLLVALLGVAVAGGSAFATREYFTVQTAKAAGDSKADLTRVVIAATDIAVGHPIQSQTISVIPWPRDALPPGAYEATAGLLPAAGQPPRRATRNFAKGEIILASKLSDYGGKVTLVQKLTPGSRAMAIKVDAATAVGGFVTPGDFVDIVLTQGGGAKLRAATILQGIRILGVDQSSDQSQDKPNVARTVTVEVTPEQGQVLALAKDAGTLSLTLRATGAEPGEAQIAAIRLSDVLSETPAKALEKKASTTVKVRRGEKPVEFVEVN